MYVCNSYIRIHSSCQSHSDQIVSRKYNVLGLVRIDINNKLELKTVLLKINLFCSSAVDGSGSNAVTTTTTLDKQRF